jgi:hypothetical protein
MLNDFNGNKNVKFFINLFDKFFINVNLITFHFRNDGSVQEAGSMDAPRGRKVPADESSAREIDDSSR